MNSLTNIIPKYSLNRGGIRNYLCTTMNKQTEKNECIDNRIVRELSISSMNAAKGDLKGEIDLNWDAVEEADSYVIECRERNSRAKWNLIDITNESKYTVKGLKWKKIYSFRVAAVNSEQQGPWSKSVEKVIS